MSNIICVVNNFIVENNLLKKATVDTSWYGIISTTSARITRSSNYKTLEHASSLN